ncbi:hypothetical protein SKZB199_0619 [Streptococcus sp. ZB199]|nr:hypothetical protein SKZB199_0619 [Streptococcus sp. ZB199]
MWENLKHEQKEKYKTLIINFASLSEAFSQKAEAEDFNDRESYVAPIVNSKFQETVFQKLFMLLVKILPTPLMMLRWSLMSNISIWLGLNPLVWTQGIKRLLNSRKIHSLGMNY